MPRDKEENVSCGSFQREGQREVGEAYRVHSYRRRRLLWVGTSKRTDSVTARMPIRSPRWEHPCLHVQDGEVKWGGNSTVRGSWVKSDQQVRDETRHKLTSMQVPELEIPVVFSAQR